MFAEIHSLLHRALGLGLEAEEINVGQMCLRAVVVFTVATIMIRLGNKRFMGKSTALDVMLGIVFGSLVSRAITGTSPFFPTLAAGFTLVLLHWICSALAFRSHVVGRMIKGQSDLLVENGQIQWSHMRKSHITEHDLREALRSAGKEPDISKVKFARLERNGDISICC